MHLSYPSLFPRGRSPCRSRSSSSESECRRFRPVHHGSFGRWRPRTSISATMWRQRSCEGWQGCKRGDRRRTVITVIVVLAAKSKQVCSNECGRRGWSVRGQRSYLACIGVARRRCVRLTTPETDGGWMLAGIELHNMFTRATCWQGLGGWRQQVCSGGGSGGGWQRR